MMSMSKYSKGDKMHIFLLGSGGPLNNNKRVASCIGVIAGPRYANSITFLKLLLYICSALLCSGFLDMNPSV